MRLVCLAGSKVACVTVLLLECDFDTSGANIVSRRGYGQEQMTVLLYDVTARFAAERAAEQCFRLGRVILTLLANLTALQLATQAEPRRKGRAPERVGRDRPEVMFAAHAPARTMDLVS